MRWKKSSPPMCRHFPPMTNLLALDCSDRACSVAVSCDDEIVEIHRSEQRLHARYLLGMVSDGLERAGLRKTDLQGIVWTRGPGSFTGLRIAAAAVQGMSFGLGIPVMGVSSLLALALRAPLQGRSKPTKIWVGIDARMGEIYTASYAYDPGSGRHAVRDKEQLVSASHYQLPRDCDIYLGSALPLVEEPDRPVKLDARAEIHAADLLHLPEVVLQASRVGQARDVEPVYLRRAEAWKKMGAG